MFFSFLVAVMEQMRTVNRPQTDDIDNISRVLHAHFMTDCFLTHYLHFRTPKSKPLQIASHPFSQKVDLLEPADSSVYFLTSGLRRLDLIRNRLTCSPPAAVTGSDTKVLLAVPLFREFRDKAACKQDKRNRDAVSVLECFAIFAGIILHNESDPDKKLSLHAGSGKKPRSKRR